MGVRVRAGFKVWDLKDLWLAREAAESAGKLLPMLDAVHRRMAEAVDAGMGKRHWSTMADCNSVAPPGGGVAAVLGNEVVGGNRHAGAAADNLRAVMVQQIAGAGQRDAVTRCIWCCRGTPGRSRR